jgi:carnitine-CoA ligase
MPQIGSAQTLPELLRAWTHATPDRMCCTTDRRSYTFAEMNERSDRIAAGLAASGIGYRDRIAIMSANREELLELFFALAKIGAVQIPLNVYLKGAFLKYQLARSSACAVIADADGLNALDSVLGELPVCKQFIALDDPGPPIGNIATAHYRELDQPGAAPQTAVGPSDCMSIMFTSGTTGMPKGCVLSHGYYIRSGTLVGDGVGLRPEDSLYSALPLFHAGGQLLVLSAGWSRGLGVTIDPVFSASRTLARAREVGATVVVGVGAMGYAMLASAPGPGDRDHGVRAMVVSPMAADSQDQFRRRFGIEPWTQIYGQTECVPMAFTPAAEPSDANGIGRPAPDLDVRLFDDHDVEVPEGQVGEICFRGRADFTMFDGYWEDPEATRQACAGGWYHSGDLGRMLPSGELQFVDRKKDSMRRRGENVSSMELEAAIAEHPAIVEVAVHAVPSQQTEDDIKACIVLRPGARPAAGELFEFFRDNLPYFMIPRYVDIIDELPKNAVGRIMKHVLREKTSTPTFDFAALGLTVASADRRT